MKEIKLNNIYVLSYEKLKTGKHFYPGALISILDPGEIRKFDLTRYKKVLLLNFIDTDIDIFDEFNDSDSTTSSDQFDESLALKVWKFLDDIKYEVSNLTIHCYFGVSRSAAVAYAIRQILNPNIVNFQCESETPNLYIMEIMEKAYDKYKSN